MAGLLVVVLIAIAVALGYYTGLPSGPRACTEEAFVCPDGSAVGRTGPNCEFAPCPTPSPTAMRKVKLSLYSTSLDQDASGNIMCSAKGLVVVGREIPFTNTPIQDAIRLLLTTKPTSAESDQGIISEFPLQGVTLGAASVNAGVLTLTFNDPDNRTGGGSCFVSILRAQIEGTAKQFPEVRSVRLMPEELFQP